MGEKKQILTKSNDWSIKRFAGCDAGFHLDLYYKASQFRAIFDMVKEAWFTIQNPKVVKEKIYLKFSGELGRKRCTDVFMTNNKGKRLRKSGGVFWKYDTTEFNQSKEFTVRWKIGKTRWEIKDIYFDKQRHWNVKVNKQIIVKKKEKSYKSNLGT